MKNQEKLIVTIPWGHHRMVKNIQRKASRIPRIRLGGNTAGLKVTGFPDDLIKLKIARVSDEISLPMVSQLRQAGVSVKGSRTVHFPGGLTAVDIQIQGGARLARQVAAALRLERGTLTIHDGAGGAVQRVFPEEPAKAPRSATRAPLAPTVRSPARRRAKADRHGDLVEAIRDLWENKGDDLIQRVDWDNSDYEAPTIRDLMMDCLGEYLSPEKLEKWENLEPELQTAILREAFPFDAAIDTTHRLERHHLNSVGNRVASLSFDDQRELMKRPSLEERRDLLDIGVGKTSKIWKLPRGKTIYDLFHS